MNESMFPFAFDLYMYIYDLPAFWPVSFWSIIFLYLIKKKNLKEAICGFIGQLFSLSILEETNEKIENT